MSTSKRARLRAPIAASFAVPTATAHPSLDDCDPLVLSRVADHLDPKSLVRLHLTRKQGFLPAEVRDQASRRTLDAAMAVPPDSVTNGWDERQWDLQAYMAHVTTPTCRENEAYFASYDARVGRYPAALYFRPLRVLENDAVTAWRHEGWRVCEELEALRSIEAPLQSLDLSALYFPPFPKLHQVVEGFPLKHLKFSTAFDAGGPPMPDMPLEAVFAQVPALTSLEVVPQKANAHRPVSPAGNPPRVHRPSFDGEFRLAHFCVALTQALESSHAPLLQHLHLDFSKVLRAPPAAIVESLAQAIASRPKLTDVNMVWPLRPGPQTVLPKIADDDPVSDPRR